MNLCYYRYISIGFVAVFALIVAALGGDLFANSGVSVLVGAGDIARCEQIEAAVKLLVRLPGRWLPRRIMSTQVVPSINSRNVGIGLGACTGGASGRRREIIVRFAAKHVEGAPIRTASGSLSPAPAALALQHQSG